MDLAKYLTRSVEHIMGDVIRATFQNPAESIFLTKFVKAVKKGNRIREQEENRGVHIPAFLVASITSSCNLHCAGCYARANEACSDAVPTQQLTAIEWKRIFLEAQELGINFIILIGGEPMIRGDVIEEAANMRDIMFPIFTNGTLIGKEYIEIFGKYRNLVPIISIEGEKNTTDTRRGAGVYKRITESMEQMKERGIIFGASATVTRDNLQEVTSDDFISQLAKKGCKAVFFIEYVPVSEEEKARALTDDERALLMERLEVLRKERKNLVFIAFPGDEKSSGGCLAAGRGFFHINSHGGAEPCPFALYSDTNVKENSVREALKSGLFQKLQSGDILKDDHTGGCVLYEKRAEVEKLVRLCNEEHK